MNVPHSCKENSRRPALRRLHGVALVYITVVLSVLIAFVALSTDLGRVVYIRSQLQIAADAAALYAAQAARNQNQNFLSYAQTSAADNPIEGRAISLQASDVQTGNFTKGVFTANAKPLNAVKVTLYFTKSRGLGVMPVFGSVIGMGAVDVTASAVALTGPNQNMGIVGISSVSLSGAATASYDSSLNPAGYASSPGNLGTVESNGNITLSGSSNINGSVLAGVGMSVNTSGSACVSGTIGTVPKPLSFPSVNPETATTVNNNALLAGTSFSATTRDLTLTNNQSLVVPAGTYYVNNLTMSGNSTLTFLGATTIYVTGAVSIGSTAIVTTTGNLPSNLSLQVVGSGAVSIANNGTLFADVYAPQSSFTLSGSGTLGGRVVANTITQSGNGQIDYDTSVGSLPGDATLAQ